MTATDVLPVLASPVIGSFLGVVVARMDVPSSIVVGRSCCTSCGTKLGALDLVPVLSWAVSRGRCRHCNAGVSVFYPAIEIGALILALWAATLISGPALWASCLLGWILLVLACIDGTRLILPDFLTLPLVLLGLGASFLFWREDFSAAAIGAVAGYGAIRLLGWGYQQIKAREGIGLGDAKLLAAGGAWVTWVGLPSVVLIASFLALFMIAFKSLRTRALSPTEPVPFGTYLCMGIWLTWLYGPVAFWF